MPTKQARRYCFTLNNYVDNDVASLESFFESHCKYLVYGKEVGESLTPHLQGFFTLNNKQSLKGLQNVLGMSFHFEPAVADSHRCSNYCKKGQQSHSEWELSGPNGPNFGLNADVTEFGNLPNPGKRTDLDRLAEAVKNGQSMRDVADLHPATYIRNYRGLANYAALQTQDYTHDTVRGIWFYGAPGVGKSHHARLYGEAQGSLYIKPQNKWFDGYTGENTILLDDLDSNALGHHLKLWADKYAVSGEIKGGTVKLQHQHFLVTSNYTPESLWPEDPVMAEAVKRRFKMIHVTGLTEHIKELNK